MKEYHHPGPAGGVVLSDGAGILLQPGKTASLPGEHNHVKILVVLKHLAPGPENTKPTVTPAVQLPKRRSSGDSEVKAEDAHGS